MRWYDDKKPGLGRDFRAGVKSAMNSLKKHPYHAIRYRDVRMLNLKQFPYALHYTVDAGTSTVTVWGVIASARDPKTYWVWHR
jgi:hypothetical protein